MRQRCARADGMARFLQAMALLLVVMGTACAQTLRAVEPRLGAPQVAGIITDAELSEISGIAVSRNHRNVLWAVNDSGNAARLYAISNRGRRLAAFDIEGVTNVDWEDLSAFVHEGRSYLLIGDVGDNGGVRSSLELILVEEPRKLADAVLRPVARLAFRWPDGARDCEAMAVDAVRGEILLVSKRRVPAQLFRLPLADLFRSSGTVSVPEEIARLHGVPQPTAEELAREPRLGRFRAQISGAALRDDGLLAIQTYRDAYVYHRGPRQSWREALRAPPRSLGATFLPQAEAIAFDPRTGDLYLASERIPTPLLRIPNRP